MVTQEHANCPSLQEANPEIVFKIFVSGQLGKGQATPDFTSLVSLGAAKSESFRCPADLLSG